MIRSALCAGAQASRIFLLLIAASCSPKYDRTVKVIAHANYFSLEFSPGPLLGLCYAPGTIEFNGNLDLGDMVGVGQWSVTQIDAARVGGLDKQLSAKIVKITHSALKFKVPRDSIVDKISYVGFYAFPCDAPREAGRWNEKIYAVSAAASLPFAIPYVPIDPEEDRYWRNQLIPYKNTSANSPDGGHD